MYGGQDRREGGIKTDMYVLSLPGFVWFKVNGTSAARSSHQCIVANNRQLLVVGGFGANSTYTVQDDWAQGLGVFDLTALAWKDRYDADAQPYEPAPAIADWYSHGYGFPPSSLLPPSRLLGERLLDEKLTGCLGQRSRLGQMERRRRQGSLRHEWYVASLSVENMCADV